jgi:hypothetical protein
MADSYEGIIEEPVSSKHFACMNSMTAHGTKSLITIVDDEACVRESLNSQIRSVGYKTKEYASAEEFLTWGWWDETACLILDVVNFLRSPNAPPEANRESKSTAGIRQKG